MAQCVQSEIQVEDALEEATHNERHGTDFEQIPSADLFYVDKVHPVFRACATRCTLLNDCYGTTQRSTA